jgi:hypothetical protein
MRRFCERKESDWAFGNAIGVSILSTPKYHAEIAGEGVEYCWALSKNWFKRLPISDRSNRCSFINCVNKALSRNIVKVQSARDCARRAHSYMLSYAYYLSTRSQSDLDDSQKLKSDDIEAFRAKFTRKYAYSHRYADDFDRKFVLVMLDSYGTTAMEVEQDSITACPGDATCCRRSQTTSL